MFPPFWQQAIRESAPAAPKKKSVEDASFLALIALLLRLSVLSFPLVNGRGKAAGRENKWIRKNERRFTKRSA